MAMMVVIAIGCEPASKDPPAYRVGYNIGLPIGSFSPNLPLITTEGKQTLFARVAGPIMVVVFLAPPGEECCQIEPEPRTVFLIDDNNRIVAIDTFQNLEIIEKKATMLSDRKIDEYEEIFQG